METEKGLRKSWIGIYPFPYIGDNVGNEEECAVGVGESENQPERSVR